jgi:hypothetical protein
MAQPAPDLLNNTMKPITLTILPQPTTQIVLGPVPTPTLSISGATRRYSPPVNTTHIPNFNHVPIQPTIVHSPAYIVGKHNKTVPSNNDNEQDNAERKKQLNREYQKKFRDKTKGFVEIAQLPSINERIKHVWQLTYPNVNIDEQTMDILIAQFVNSMLTSRTY